MPNHTDSLLHSYLKRLVLFIVSSEEDAEYLLREVLQRIQHGAESQRTYQLSEVLPAVRRLVPQHSFAQVESIIEQLVRIEDANVVARYLVVLSTILRDYAGKRESAEKDYKSVIDDRASHYGHLTVDSFENANFDRMSDRRSVYSALYNEPRTLTMEDTLIPYLEDQVPEQDILRSLPYSLLGTTSDLFPLKDGAILLPRNISNGLSGVLHVILEAGLVYQKLCQVIDSSKGYESSQVHVALLSFVSDQISGYVQLVNEISIRQHFTLKSIYSDLLDTVVRLRFLLFILKTTEGKPPYEMLSIIHSYHDHGDPEIQSCARRMLGYTLEPFLKSLSEWIIRGELNEKNNGFFVNRQPQNQQSLSLGVYYQADSVPSFLDVALSGKIYSIGLMIVFLKYHCRQMKWISEFSERTGTLFNQLRLNASANFIKGAKFHAFIDNTYASLLNFMTFIIHDKFSLMATLTALRDYLLMGRGDFIQAIIDNGRELLSEPSNSLTGHQLTRLLHESASNTTSRYELSNLGDLDARLLAIGHGNVGWDVFTLDYRVESPLNILINDSSNQFKKDYLRVFNHLWKIQRLCDSYTQLWLQWKNVQTAEKRITRIRLIHNFILGVFESIQSFIYYEIIENAYADLQKKFRRSDEMVQFDISTVSSKLKVSSVVLKPSLDYLKQINLSDDATNTFETIFQEIPIQDIQKFHSQFLHSITKHKLMDISKDSNRGTISNKFLINQFNSLVQIAFKFSLAETELIKLLSLEDTEWNSQREDDQRKEAIFKNLLMLFNEFNGDLKTFVADLSNDQDIQLRHLGLVLNH